MRSVRRKAMALAITAGLAAWAPAEARASSAGDGALVAVLATAFLADVGFSAYDIAVATKRQAPARGAAIAEAIVAMPQALISSAGFAVMLPKDRSQEPFTVLAIFPPMWTGALATHGIWAASSDRVRPELLPALSLMVGTNATLSTFAIAHAARGRLLSRPLGIGAMVLTVPQIAVAIPAAVKSDRDRAGWIGAAGWSGALFVHGLVSTIFGGRRPDPDPPPPRPPELPPPLPEKPPLLVPASIEVTPAVIAGPLSNAPGIVVRGALF